MRFHLQSARVGALRHRRSASWAVVMNRRSLGWGLSFVRTTETSFTGMIPSMGFPVFCRSMSFPWFPFREGMKGWLSNFLRCAMCQNGEAPIQS